MLVRHLAAYLLCLLFSSALLAQAYPAKPIRLVVPLPPGALTDIVMRANAQELSSRLGQPLVVDNRPGGNWVIGVESCLKGGADGYTLCVVNSDAMSYNPYILSSMSYDPGKDFTPVTNLFFLIEGILAKASLPVNTIAELQAYARANPGKVNFGTLGPGSSPDVFRQWLEQQWKAEMAGIPYKGGGNVVSAILGGEIDVAKIGMGNVAGQLSKVKVLAIQSGARSKLIPNVPITREVGLGAFPVRVWWGLVMNAGTPDNAIARINNEFGRLYREQKTAEYLESQFVEVAVNTPQEFSDFLKADRARAAEVVKAFNIPKQ
jgi:tripartite-type tricarboxylate transporter receptor subunit TctC